MHLNFFLNFFFSSTSNQPAKQKMSDNIPNKEQNEEMDESMMDVDEAKNLEETTDLFIITSNFGLAISRLRKEATNHELECQCVVCRKAENDINKSNVKIIAQLTVKFFKIIFILIIFQCHGFEGLNATEQENLLRSILACKFGSRVNYADGVHVRLTPNGNRYIAFTNVAAYNRALSITEFTWNKVTFDIKFNIFIQFF